MDKKLSELPSAAQELCRLSLEARKASYSPYSRFQVGAALRCSDGEAVLGCNVENASYGLAICAERTACVKAVSQGRTSFDAVAISGDLSDGSFVVPCGACRQFLCEFEPRLPVYLVRASDRAAVVRVTSLDALLPECFSPKTMNLDFRKE